MLHDVILFILDLIHAQKGFSLLAVRLRHGTCDNLSLRPWSWHCIPEYLIWQDRFLVYIRIINLKSIPNYVIFDFPMLHIFGDVLHNLIVSFINK